jgi:hypothetical protein
MKWTVEEEMLIFQCVLSDWCHAKILNLLLLYQNSDNNNDEGPHRTLASLRCHMVDLRRKHREARIWDEDRKVWRKDKLRMLFIDLYGEEPMFDTCIFFVAIRSDLHSSSDLRSLHQTPLLEADSDG